MTAIPLGAGKHRVTWRLAFHGVTRNIDGELLARAVDADSILVEGEHDFDVRNWGVEPGEVLGVHVHPEADFAVHLLARRQLDSQREGGGDASGGSYFESLLRMPRA